MSRLLILSPYPSSAPSHRVRLEQYVPSLEGRGVQVTVRSLLDERAYRSRGARLAAGVVLGSAGRVVEALGAGRYDVVLVHREAVPLPTAVVERLLARTARRLVFDFDDAIYLPQPGTRTPLASWLRSPAKFGATVGAADRVLAGNRVLAERARRYASDVRIIPTTVDTDRMTPGTPRRRERLVIGWIGSPSTSAYLEVAAPALRALLDRYRNVDLRLVGAHSRTSLADRATLVPWSLERELEELRRFDIGIMPLPDDEWARGKCGYKALQYMSAGVATVSSPVGVATEIVDGGRAGLLASTHEEWLHALRSLVEETARRRDIAEAGRATVEERYSLRVWAPLFAEAMLGI